jgi:hypothetical protein
MISTVNPIKLIKRSIKSPVDGDIFCFSWQSDVGPFNWGRVVNTHTRIGGFDDVILVYFFKHTTHNKIPPDDLLVEDFLIKPSGTNALGWKRGFFEVRSNREFKEGEKLERHVFTRWNDKLYDEYGSLVVDAVANSGDFSLCSYLNLIDSCANAK